MVNSPGPVDPGRDTEPLEELLPSWKRNRNSFAGCGLITRSTPTRWSRSRTSSWKPWPTSSLAPPRSPTSLPSRAEFAPGKKIRRRILVENVRESVLFRTGDLNSLIRAGEDSFLELGPHPALQNPIMECLRAGTQGCLFLQSQAEDRRVSRKCSRIWRNCTTTATRSTGNPSTRPPVAGFACPITPGRKNSGLESEEGEYLRCARFGTPSPRSESRPFAKSRPGVLSSTRVILPGSTITVSGTASSSRPPGMEKSVSPLLGRCSLTKTTSSRISK